MIFHSQLDHSIGSYFLKSASASKNTTDLSMCAFRGFMVTVVVSPVHIHYEKILFLEQCATLQCVFAQNEDWTFPISYTDITLSRDLFTANVDRRDNYSNL